MKSGGRWDAHSIAQWRMRNQRMWGAPFRDMPSMFAALGAIQGQEYGIAKWSVGQRVKGLDLAGFHRAYDEGEVLRTHALRPTWHLVGPEDIVWIQELTGPRVDAGAATSYRRHDITPKLRTRVAGIFTKALEGGNHLTRIELSEVLAKHRIEATGQRLAWIVMTAELDAVICSGPARGKQLTYGLVSERAPQAASLDPDDALIELTRRYFTSRGPATLKDYAWWSSLRMGDIRRAIEMLGDVLQSQKVEDRTYWFAPGRPGRKVQGVVDLVQPYEEVIISYTESRDAVVGDGSAWGTPVGRTYYYNAILLDGRLVGHWRQKVAKDAVKVELVTRRRLQPAQRRALEEAIGRYEVFLGVPIQWEDLTP